MTGLGFTFIRTVRARARLIRESEIVVGRRHAAREGKLSSADLTSVDTTMSRQLVQKRWGDPEVDDALRASTLGQPQH